jgi:hypothetical protein
MRKPAILTTVSRGLSQHLHIIASMIGSLMHTEQLVEGHLVEETEVLRAILPQRHFMQHESHTT